MSYVQFSSFQIGKMLDVSRQAVNQWIDKGYIKSYRTPGGHRRVKREDLLAFLKAREIPVPEILRAEAEGTPELGPSPRIMLVDDDNEFLALLQNAIIDKLPHAQVTRHNDGYDALMAIGANPPDLLMLDLRMPNINGLEVCRRLKENPLTQNLPIMVVTGYESAEWREDLKGLKVDVVLSKSMPLLDLASAVADFVREHVAVEQFVD